LLANSELFSFFLSFLHSMLQYPRHERMKESDKQMVQYSIVI
jgi:hypothetical protein